MLSSLQNPQAFSITLAFCTALLVYLYTRTTEPDRDKVNKTFFKTLAIGIIVGLVLSYIVYKPEPTMSEPFFDN
jgi:amino acid transporter